MVKNVAAAPKAEKFHAAATNGQGNNSADNTSFMEKKEDGKTASPGD